MNKRKYVRQLGDFVIMDISFLPWRISHLCSLFLVDLCGMTMSSLNRV